MSEAIGLLQDCVSLAVWFVEKRKELKDNKDGCKDLCSTVEQLAEALQALQNGPRPAIDAKSLILRDLQTLLRDCKTFVEAYHSRGFFSRAAGTLVSSDKHKLKDFQDRIDSLLIRFGFIQTADTAKQSAVAGKLGDSIARASWADCKTYEELGDGATSKVFRGAWKHNEVAIKKINTKTEIAQVRKELDAIHRLGGHKRIVSLMAICQDVPDWRLAIIMELARHGDLQTYLESRSIYDVPLVLQLRLLYDIADGMTYCHERNLIHMDLKTKNVVVDEAHRAKICDFGMSRFIEAGKSGMTASLGTPQYS